MSGALGFAAHTIVSKRTNSPDSPFTRVAHTRSTDPSFTIGASATLGSPTTCISTFG
jgi:hypothetical protein